MIHGYISLLFQSFFTNYPTSYPMGIGLKVAGAWSWSLTSI